MRTVPDARRACGDGYCAGAIGVRGGGEGIGLETAIRRRGPRSSSRIGVVGGGGSRAGDPEPRHVVRRLGGYGGEPAVDCARRGGQQMEWKGSWPGTDQRQRAKQGIGGGKERGCAHGKDRF